MEGKTRPILEGSPFITACMPVHNADWCLMAVLSSLYSLKYPKKKLRLVFVDDGSTDKSYSILQEFKERHEKEYESIILLKTSNRGLGAARNTCLKFVNGWVLWIDSDNCVPSDLIAVAISHFQRDPDVGWVNIPWIRRNPTLLEKISMSRIPRTFRYVEEAEVGCSLLRPEVIAVMGAFHEGIKKGSYMAISDQYLKIRKAGWNIIKDGTISDRCIHLCTPNGHWGQFFPPSNPRKYSVAIKHLINYARYQVLSAPKRPIHHMIKVGDIKLAVKLIYYFFFPYFVIFSLLTFQLFPLLYILPSFVYYITQARGLRMKLIAPPFLIARWILISQGYSLLLIKKLIRKAVRTL